VSGREDWTDGESWRVWLGREARDWSVTGSLGRDVLEMAEWDQNHPCKGLFCSEGDNGAALARAAFRS
jgi:hypothetical protein